MTKVPEYNHTYSPKYEKKKEKLKVIRAKYSDHWRFTQESRRITDRLREISHQMLALKVEKAELREVLKKRELLKKQKRLFTVQLYVLSLEDGCWYVGMSYNPDKRFVSHKKGKGAAWTRLHKPLSIHETRPTDFYDQDSAAKLEDDLTLEYALKYGSQFVRGGGWCQMKPHWPDVITHNERAGF